MKIYMIHPRFSDTFWSIFPWWTSPHHEGSLDRWSAVDVLGVDAYMPPIALATLAALTPSDIDVEIVDNNAGDPIDFEKRCDLVCITAYTNQSPEARAIARRFQARGIPVALGGPHASTAPEECGFVDHLFVGEAEYTWPRFLEELRRGEARKVYHQVEKVDMKTSPVPKWDAIDLRRYSDGTIQTTRGCPFDCEYCDVIVFNGRKPCSKTHKQVLDDIRIQSAAGIETIFISDDNFIGNSSHAKKLLKEIVALQQDLERPMQFIAQLTINCAHDESLLKLLADANFTALFIGVETPRRASLEECSKPQNYIRDLRADLRRIGAYGMVPVTGMIVGFDNDDPSIFDEQLEFINSTPLLVTRCNVLTAIPHTQFWHRMRDEKRLVEEDVRAKDDSRMLPNFYPKQFSREALFYSHLDFLERVWSVENMEARLVRYLRQVEYVPDIARHPPSRKQLGILGRLLHKMATSPDSGERRLFFKLFYHVMRINPKAMRPALFSFVNGMASRNVMKSVRAQEADRLRRFKLHGSGQPRPLVAPSTVAGRPDPSIAQALHG